MPLPPWSDRSDHVSRLRTVGPTCPNTLSRPLPVFPSYLLSPPRPSSSSPPHRLDVNRKESRRRRSSRDSSCVSAPRRGQGDLTSRRGPHVEGVSRHTTRCPTLASEPGRCRSCLGSVSASGSFSSTGLSDCSPGVSASVGSSGSHCRFTGRTGSLLPVWFEDDSTGPFRTFHVTGHPDDLKFVSGKSQGLERDGTPSFQLVLKIWGVTVINYEVHDRN